MKTPRDSNRPLALLAAAVWVLLAVMPATMLGQMAAEDSANLPVVSPSAQTDSAQMTAPPPVIVPAGTRVVMTLISPLHSTSAGPDSGIYLQTLFPVVSNNQVVIPAHTAVQGVVEASRRPGHIRRTAELRLRFTDLIFPNNRVLPIDAVLQSLPGSPVNRVRDNRGTIKPVDQSEKPLVPIAALALTGGLLGSIHHAGMGTLVGAGVGAAIGAGSVLLARGDEIQLREGTKIEMILQKPLAIDAELLKKNAELALNLNHGRSAAAAVETPPAQDPQTMATSRATRRRTPPPGCGSPFPVPPLLCRQWP